MDLQSVQWHTPYWLLIMLFYIITFNFQNCLIESLSTEIFFQKEMFSADLSVCCFIPVKN